MWTDNRSIPLVIPTVKEDIAASSILSLIAPAMYQAGTPPITRHAEPRHKTCSVDESKWANHANAWRPPYMNDAVLNPRPTEKDLRLSNSGQSWHREVIALLIKILYRVPSPFRNLNAWTVRQAIFQRVMSGHESLILGSFTLGENGSSSSYKSIQSRRTVRTELEISSGVGALKDVPAR